MTREWQFVEVDAELISHNLSQLVSIAKEVGLKMNNLNAQAWQLTNKHALHMNMEYGNARHPVVR